jgi:hypothetical protein
MECFEPEKTEISYIIDRRTWGKKSLLGDLGAFRVELETPCALDYI